MLSPGFLNLSGSYSTPLAAGLFIGRRHRISGQGFGHVLLRVGVRDLGVLEDNSAGQPEFELEHMRHP
jgi:hypothetical protein